MFDPFVDAKPSALVHEVDGRDFAAAWDRLMAGEDTVACPLCGQLGIEQSGTSAHTSRPWIRFACGDVVAQEVTAG